MSALTVAQAPAAAPSLRRRAVPLTAPRPAVHVLIPPDQPAGPPRPPHTQEALVLDTLAPARTAATGAAAAPASGGGGGQTPPEAVRWAGQFVQAAVEVAAGLRPPAQLTRWATDDVREALGRRGALNRRRGICDASRRRVVRSVRASSPRTGVAEASAVVSDGTRLRAVALRMETVEGRWRVTALQLG